jgi:AAA domain/Nuclease-related domain
MAQILPSFSDDITASGATPAEWMTLKVLEQGLQEDWYVFHNIRWTQAREHGTNVGEIDFCVLSPSGKVIVVEQKNGDLIESPEGIFKRYPNGPKNVGTQIQRTLDGLHSKFKRFNPDGGFWADYLIYLPDYRVKEINAAALDPERIVDASRRDQLCTIIQKILKQDPAKPTPDRFEKVRDFLLDTYELVRDVHAYGKLQNEIYCNISGGLTTWVSRLSFEPFHLRIQGTAGCGKTQLAMAELSRTVVTSKKAILVCFNHALAARLASIAPEGSKVTTFHRLCNEWVQSAGQNLNNSQGATVFDEMVVQAQKIPVPEGWEVDTLVIDEGQDMLQSWADLVMRVAKPNARILWIEDQNQQLYARDRVQLKDFIKLDVPVNYRSPQKIQQAIEMLLDLGTETGNPFPGLDPEFHTYESTQDLFSQVRTRLDVLIEQGFSKENIAIISFRGIKKSAFSNMDRIGKYDLKRFTGEYDSEGQQIMR